MSVAEATPQAPPVVAFVEHLPGLPHETSFHLVRLDEVGALYSMRAVADTETFLLLAAAPVFHPEYAPVIDDESCDELKLTDAHDAAVFLVVTAGETLADSTVNLLAPVIVNVHSGHAKQVVLTGSGFPVQAPLVSGK